MASALHTIGYGNRSIEAFIKLLLEHHLGYVVDVRSQPYSRQFSDYRKAELELHLAEAGIRYVFMGKELGGKPENPNLKGFDGKPDYAAIRRYEPYREGLSRMRIAHDKGVRLAMMCAELRPENCHRAKLIGESLYEQGINIGHIDADGTIRLQEEVRNRWLGGRELELF